MPLTVRSNGSSSGNIIQASWFNDYHDLLTGLMPDQPVTIKNTLSLQAIGGPPATAPALALNTGTALGIGAYGYVITYATPNADGESGPSPAATITTTSGNQSVKLTSIPVGPTGTAWRKIYRTVVGGGTNYKYVDSLYDNTTTTYTDNIPDASLGGPHPASPSFGGALIIKDQDGNVKFQINNDGSFSAGGSTGFGNTTITGSLTVSGTSTLNGIVLLGLGRIGKSASGDILDANGTTTFLKGTAGITFQAPNGTSVGSINSNGNLSANGSITAGANLVAQNGFNLNGGALNLYSGATVNAANLSFNGTGINFINNLTVSGTLLLSPTNQSTPSCITTGNAGIGFKMNNGTKIAEMKGNGNFIIGGNTYYTAVSTYSYSANGTFDGFDVAEVFEMDQEYPAGTVVCPKDGTMQMTQCTHVGCNLAGVIVTQPGFGMGVPNVPSDPADYNSSMPITQYVSLVGRIIANADPSIPIRTYVISNGDGKVRAATSSDAGLTAVGVSLDVDSNGTVPVMIRPTKI